MEKSEGFWSRLWAGYTYLDFDETPQEKSDNSYEDIEFVRAQLKLKPNFEPLQWRLKLLEMNERLQKNPELARHFAS